MPHVVEIRLAGENFHEVMSRVRGWLNCQDFYPTTFRDRLSEPDTVLHVNFEFKAQAQTLAEAVGGVLLV
jgi:hypothetical protein